MRGQRTVDSIGGFHVHQVGLGAVEAQTQESALTLGPNFYGRCGDGSTPFVIGHEVVINEAIAAAIVGGIGSVFGHERRSPDCSLLQVVQSNVTIPNSERVRKVASNAALTCPCSLPTISSPSEQLAEIWGTSGWIDRVRVCNA